MKRVRLAFTCAVLFGSMQSQAWTVANDMEDGSLGAQAANGRQQTVYSSDQSHSGNKSGKMTINGGSVGKYWGGGLNFPTSLTQGDELWWRMYWYFPSNFDFNAEPVFKLMRVAIENSYFSVLGKGGGRMISSNDPVGSDWFQGNAGARDNLGNLKKGVWQAVEIYMKLHSVNGQAVTRVWLDGKIVFEDTKIRNLPNASTKSVKTLIGTYWNGGAPKTQSNYIDDLVWTTEKPSNRDAQGNPFIGLGKSSPQSSTPVVQPSSPPVPPVVKSN